MVDGSTIRPSCRRIVEKDLEKQGLRFELQANTQEIIGDKQVEGIRLSDGRVLDADMVVMAVGIRPVTKEARSRVRHRSWYYRGRLYANE